MTYDILGLIGLLILSGFFSASELAFVSANKIKIELRARKKNLAAVNADHFVRHSHVFFSTILISNNIINIAFASLITVFLATAFQMGDITILIISSALLLLFGELLPKYFARELADSYILYTAIPIRIVSLVLYPFVWVTSAFSSFITRAANINEESISHLFDKEDMQSLIDESSQTISDEDDTYDILSKIINMGDQKIYEAMTPRTDIVGVEINSSVKEVIEVFIESGYSKIPVYEENLDDVKGIVYAYDMFKNPENLRSVMREVIFVPETKRTLDMLNELLDKRVSIAVVVDEFGGTAGIITTEDILEEMLGEIMDEYDVEEDVLRKVDEKTYIISGKVEIDHINEQFGLNIPEGDYETLGGYIITELGKIPVQGLSFHSVNFDISILKATKKKIDLVKLVVTDDQQGIM